MQQRVGFCGMMRKDLGAVNVKMRAVIYNRVSTSEQEPELQLGDCRKFCRERDWKVVKVFTEKASAWKDDVERPIFNSMIEFVKGGADVIVVWRMDRFSRQPEETVLEQVRMLKLMHAVKVCAVRGDAWSELVNTIGSLEGSGFIGKALLEFLETVIRGLEHQRAFRESQVKSERVKLAVVRKGGKTFSYKGNRWGRKSYPPQTVRRVLELREQGLSIREIQKEVVIHLNGKTRNISRGGVHKIITENTGEKT